jgi:hypothetical protein
MARVALARELDPGAMTERDCIAAVAGVFGVLPRRVSVHLPAPGEANFTVRPGPFHFTDAELAMLTEEARDYLPVHVLFRFELREYRDVQMGDVTLKNVLAGTWVPGMPMPSTT